MDRREESRDKRGVRGERREQEGRGDRESRARENADYNRSKMRSV